MSDVYAVTLANDLAEVGRLLDGVEHFLADQQVAIGQANPLMMILDEIVTNTLIHGFASKETPHQDDNRGQRIEIHLCYKPGDPACIEGRIRDNAPPFDPLADVDADPQLDATLDEREIGGLGIHFVKHYAETLSYRRDGDWNQLSFICRIPSPA